MKKVVQVAMAMTNRTFAIVANFSNVDNRDAIENNCTILQYIVTQ